MIVNGFVQNFYRKMKSFTFPNSFSTEHITLSSINYMKNSCAKAHPKFPGVKHFEKTCFSMAFDFC